MAFDFLARLERISPANLTIREQVRLAENPLETRYRALAPRVPTDSILIRTMETPLASRITGGRREWNAQGRELVERVGPMLEAEMIPINPTHHIDERRMHLLRERARQQQPLFQADVIGTVDTWAQRLADACEWQLERDFFEMWDSGAVTVRDTKSGASTTVPLDIEAGRYVNEGTSWVSGSVNAFDRLLYHIEEAQRLLGDVPAAVRMRRETARRIVDSAPQGTYVGERATMANLQARVREEGFPDFTVIVDERTVQEHTNGGSAQAEVKLVRAGKLLFQPAGRPVADTFVAPVTRAEDYIPNVQDAGVNLQDVTVFYRPKNDGKTLMLEAQENAMALLRESSVYVVNTTPT